MPLEVLDANPLSELTPDEIRTQFAEIELSKRVGEALERMYPGHLWAVRAHGGVVYVQNLALDGQWGFVLHSHQLVNQDVEQVAMRSGGELLERFRISRGRGGADQAGAFLQQRMRSAVLTLPSWAR